MVNVKNFIKDNADTNYADFNRKFINSKYPIIGVRIPILRKFSKDIEPEYIELNQGLSHEEVLLYGFSASNYKNESDQLEYLQNILPFIDNWATCDCIVSAMKQLTGEKSYKYFSNLLKNHSEFEIRIGIIGLMRNFLKTEKIVEILSNIKEISNSDYYVQMAIAWFYAELATNNFDLAYKTIETTDDKFIRSKAISKATDSYRITKEQKALLSKLRIATKKYSF